MIAMITTDRLFFWARLFGITVVFKNLQKKHPGLLGVADAENMRVTLDSSLKNTPLQLRCILAEEIGHILFPPRPGHIRYHSRGFWDIDHYERSNIKHIVAQDERKAIDWATNILLPNVELSHIMSIGARNIYELADYYDVEPWFMAFKINYLKRKARTHGEKVRWKDILKKGPRENNLKRDI